MLLPWFLYYLTFAQAIPLGRRSMPKIGSEYRPHRSDKTKSLENSVIKGHSGVCTTESCYQMAKKLLDSKDDSVHPCDNFYQHACGNWIKQNPIPDNEVEWSRDREVVEKTYRRIRDLLQEENDSDIPPVKMAKQFYRSCMDTDAIEKAGIKPIQDMLDKTGGWPMAMPMSEWNSTRSWQDLDRLYFPLLSGSAVYNLEYQRDDNDMNRNILRIDQYVRHPLSKKNTVEKIKFNVSKNYKRAILLVAEVFALKKGYVIKREKLEEDAQDLVDFEAQLELIIEEEKKQREAGYNYTIMTIEELQKWYDSVSYSSPTAKINFSDTFRYVFKKGNIDLQASEPILVQNKDSLHALAKLLDKTPPRVIVNYIQWNMMSEFLPFTTQQMRDIMFNIRYAKYNISSKHERWKTCVADMELRDAVAYIFVKKYFPNHVLGTVSDMITQIQNIFQTRINQSHWITPELRHFMTQKMENMVMQIGYPEWYNNETAIIHRYEGLTLGKSYFENMINCQFYEVKRSLKEFREVSGRIIWLDYAFTVNAFYSETTNVIILPAAELQDPYFAEFLPDAVNYGAVGFVIGHELSHAYDTDGVEHDKDGRKISWSTTELLDDYEERASCFVRQFNNYSLDIVDETGDIIQINGDFTEDENMADSIGIQAAFAAYQNFKQKGKVQLKLPGLEHYSDEKLFFLSFANAWCSTSRPDFEADIIDEDEHSPPKFRIIGSLSNMKMFSKTFDCPLGSPMNPEKKCDLWA